MAASLFASVQEKFRNLFGEGSPSTIDMIQHLISLAVLEFQEGCQVILLSITLFMAQKPVKDWFSIPTG